jgi:NAD-reducing hydrogenase small subunit
VLLERAYIENTTVNPQVPSEVVPGLLRRSLPVHKVVAVDVFLPGCPPSADLIYDCLDQLFAGQIPDAAHIARFRG